MTIMRNEINRQRIKEIKFKLKHGFSFEETLNDLELAMEKMHIERMKFEEFMKKVIGHGAD